MDDTLICLICGNKLKNLKLPEKHLHAVNKTANYVERTCTGGINHFFQSYTDEQSKLIDFITVSVSPTYSIYVDVDFLNKKSRISCLKNNEPFNIELPKLLILDFPKFEKLKEKINILITLS